MTPSIGTSTLAGTLGSIGIQDVLGFLATQRLAGLLEVTCREGSMALYLHRGILVWGRAHKGLDPGELLIRRGRLTREALADIRRRVGTAHGIYQELARLGHLPEEQIEALASEELCENVFRLCTWTAGTFRFQEAATLPPGVEPVRVDVASLLIEAARRCDEWSRLPELYAQGDSRFELTADPTQEERISLELDEWKLLYLVSSARTLAEIWKESPLGSHLETSRTLYGLAVTGLIRPAGPGAPASPGSAAASDAPQAPLPKAAGELDETLAPAGELLATLDLPPRPEPPAEEPMRRWTRSQIRVVQKGRLDVTRPESDKRSFPVGEASLTIGRSKHNDVVLDDAHVSAKHARLGRDGDHFVIEDVGSSNGIRVNDRKTARMFLHGGDEIEIFPFRLRFDLDFEISAPP